LTASFNHYVTRRRFLFPDGWQTLAGTDFDVRGAVMLQFPRSTALLPLRVSGISVRRHCRRLHFLHATFGAYPPPGKRVGTYVIHYRDGQQSEISLHYGEHIGPWNPRTQMHTDLEGATVAWQSQYYPIAVNRLYKLTWHNPRPDVEVSHLDFLSAMNGTSPFLVALTAE
jgi:hypothetical protein